MGVSNIFFIKLFMNVLICIAKIKKETINYIKHLNVYYTNFYIDLHQFLSISTLLFIKIKLYPCVSTCIKIYIPSKTL